jgi:predicted GNAT family acetyltransferase
MTEQEDRIVELEKAKEFLRGEMQRYKALSEDLAARLEQTKEQSEGFRRALENERQHHRLLLEWRQTHKTIFDSDDDTIVGVAEKRRDELDAQLQERGL